MNYAFINSLEQGWDHAISELEKYTRNENIRLLCGLYWYGYKTEDYQRDLDPDAGLCWAIRKFAIEEILDRL